MDSPRRMIIRRRGLLALEQLTPAERGQYHKRINFIFLAAFCIQDTE